MIVVIFEVLPHAEKKQTYLDIAAALRPILVEMDGFISIERFQSLHDPEKILSLSFGAMKLPLLLGAIQNNTGWHKAQVDTIFFHTTVFVSLKYHVIMDY